MSSNINKTELLDNIKESLNLRAEESSSYVEYLLKLCAIEVSKKFSTLFHEEETFSTDANGVVELPVDTFRMISVQHSDREAQPLSLREFNVYESKGLAFTDSLFACVKRDCDKLQLRLLPKGSYENLKVIYQRVNDGVASIPFHEQEVLFWGTRYRFLSTKRTMETDQIEVAFSNYDRKVKELQLEQNKMNPNSRLKNFWEADWERSFSFHGFNEVRDI